MPSPKQLSALSSGEIDLGLANDYIELEDCVGFLTPLIDGTHDGLHTVWALAGQGKGWCLGFRPQAERPPHGTIGIPVAGLDLSWGVNILSREHESNPAVRVVIEVLKSAARQKASAVRVRAAVS